MLEFISDLFKSDAEKQVDALYGTTPAAPGVQFIDGFATETTVKPDANSISFLDSLREAVTPESYGESVVNQIYSDPARTLLPDPNYNVADFSSPNVYVAAKGAVTKALDTAGAFSNKLLLYGVLLLLLGVAVYALVPALVGAVVRR